MLLCRTGRLSAAALGQAFKSGSFLVQTNAPRDVTVTARTVQRYRLLCASVGGVDPSRAHLEKRKPAPAQKWDATFGFVTTDWGHLDRVATVAAGLSRSAQREGGEFDTIRRPLVYAKRRHNNRGEPATGNVWFTGSWELSRTMHTRASSTKNSEAGEGQAVSNKGDVQTLKEASTTSPTEKDPVETEPEGGKPTKTEQLKKVFKEYGAVGVSFHIGISLMSLGMFYLLISSGIDMAAILCKVGFSEAVVQSKMAAGTSTFVLAYAIHKLFAPVRISITLVSVPLIVRYFRKTGLFKPPTPAP
ncbi:protein FAM210B, mitochondrial [Acanthochromis polyacanthus]|uniref:protein FAM210B, mitochondrial n=1 Tax=Acanthochromis polyacanthus TaxID=80966 RepID=UPI0022344F2F|nr:protein FAM210B, mitochondrial [Acanthochromis polyacanthus]